MRSGRDARRRRARLAGRQATWLRVTAAASSAALLGTLGLAGTSMAATAKAAKPVTARGRHSQSCRRATWATASSTWSQLTFDNVHYFRDNPNVPSDLELMPNLLNFFEEQRHVPVQQPHAADRAHRRRHPDHVHRPVRRPAGHADLQQLPGLQRRRPERQLQHHRPGGLVRLLDRPGLRHQDAAERRATTPTRTWSTRRCPRPPRRTPWRPDTVTPAPWVPFTRAGCDVAEVATANQELENTAVDIPKVFGANSPEAQQLAADTDSFKDAETADYVGIGVHCAQGNAFCATAKGVKFGQSTASPTAVADVLPDEPGGYSGFQALFGHRYVAPQLGAGTPNLTHHGYQVTNAAGNLVDENGNQINGAFLSNHPGFPGFGPINASQTLAYTADMLESGVPVVNGYIADIHGNEHIPGLTACNGAPSALGPRHPVLHRPGQVLQRRVRHLLPAAGRRRHQRVQHRVRAQLGRGRPRGRRQRRPGHPAHAGQLRRRDRAVHLPGRDVRRAGRQHHRPARHRRRTTPRRSAWNRTRRLSSTSPAIPARTRRRCARWNATSPA